MKNLFLALFSIVFLFSCEQNTDPSKVYKPNSNGSQGEIRVVMHDLMWNGNFGEKVQEKLAPMIEYYPDGERTFDLIHTSEQSFDAGQKRFKNIVQFKIISHPKLESGISFSKKSSILS